MTRNFLMFFTPKREELGPGGFRNNPDGSPLLERSPADELLLFLWRGSNVAVDQKGLYLE